MDEENNNDSPNRSFFKTVLGEKSVKKYLQGSGSDDDTIQSLVEMSTEDNNKLIHPKLI